MTALVAAIVAGLVVMIGACVDEDGRKEAALKTAQNACAPKAAQSYDIQGQSNIVYGCAPDYRMRTIHYGHNYLWWVP